VCILCAFAGGCTWTALGGSSDVCGSGGVVGGDGWWETGSCDEGDSAGGDCVVGEEAGTADEGDQMRSDPGGGGRPGGLWTRIPEKIGPGSSAAGVSGVAGAGCEGGKYGKTDSSNVT
jgi:hypothetical protein